MKKNFKKYLCFILVVIMISSGSISAFASVSESSTMTENGYSWSLVEQTKDSQKYEIINLKTGDIEYLIQEEKDGEVVYTSISPDNEVFTIKDENGYIAVRNSDNRIVQMVIDPDATEKQIEEIIELEGLVRGSGDYGDWMTYTTYASTNIATFIVGVVSAILAYIAHVDKDLNLIISIATSVVILCLPTVYFKGDRNIRYSFDGLTLQEQYVTTFYTVSNYTNSLGTVTSAIVTRIMK
jgi:hypothetical protein